MKKSKSRIVSYSQKNLPKPSAEEIQRFLSMPENKKAISIRIDADVYNWFKNIGAGYQSHINAVLKSYVTHMKRSKKE